MENLCIIVQDVRSSSRGTEVWGNIYSGTLNIGDRLVLAAGGNSVFTRCLGILNKVLKKFVTQASAGDDVMIIISANMFFSAIESPFMWGENIPRYSKLHVSVNTDTAQQKELSDKLKKISFGQVFISDFGKELIGSGKVVDFFEDYCCVFIELLYPVWVVENQTLELFKSGEKLLQGKIIELL